MECFSPIQNKMMRVVLDEETGTYDARSDALYSFGDAVMEALVSGKGPLGPIGCFGLFFGILVRETVGMTVVVLQ